MAGGQSHSSRKSVKGPSQEVDNQEPLEIIKTSSELEALCDALLAEPYVAIDTEFLRDTTYWPQLCLVQVAGPSGRAAIIDPIGGLSLAPLFAFLNESEPTKVFHAARQDLEIFFHLSGAMPKNIYDTQIAAMVCGYGESVGYETLVRTIANVQVDKSARFTDWRRRPLSDKQLRYAISDVTHLCTVYEHLEEKLKAENRLGWIEEDVAKLANPATYDLSPENSWRRLKLRDARPRAVAIAMEVAAWREREAQSRDTPRGRVLKDEAIAEILHERPITRDDLSKLRAIPRGWGNSDMGKGLLEAVQRGLDRSTDGISSIKTRRREPAAPARVDLLKALLRSRSEQYNVAQKLISSTADLDAFAAGELDGLAFLSGWRYELFGEDAERLLRGEVALLLAGDHVKLVRQ